MSKEHHLLVMYFINIIFCNIISVFNVTFDSFNASMMIKSTTLIIIRNVSYYNDLFNNKLL